MLYTTLASAAASFHMPFLAPRTGRAGQRHPPKKCWRGTRRTRPTQGDVSFLLVRNTHRLEGGTHCTRQARIVGRRPPHPTMSQFTNEGGTHIRHGAVSCQGGPWRHAYRRAARRSTTRRRGGFSPPFNTGQASRPHPSRRNRPVPAGLYRCASRGAQGPAIRTTGTRRADGRRWTRSGARAPFGAPAPARLRQPLGARLSSSPPHAHALLVCVLYCVQRGGGASGRVRRLVPGPLDPRGEPGLDQLVRLRRVGIQTVEGPARTDGRAENGG